MFASLWKVPTARRTALDPLDTQFDPEDPGKPFCVGKCLLEELVDPVRCETMRGKLKKGVEDVKANGAVVQKKVSREYQSYLDMLAKSVLVLDDLQAVVLRSIGSSDQAMSQLAQSDEAMARLARSSEAMNKLAESDQAIENLGQSDRAMNKLAQSDQAIARFTRSPEAMKKLVESDEAISQLAQSEAAMRKLLGPELFALWKAQQNKPQD